MSKSSAWVALYSRGLPSISSSCWLHCVARPSSAEGELATSTCAQHNKRKAHLFTHTYMYTRTHAHTSSFARVRARRRPAENEGEAADMAPLKRAREGSRPAENLTSSNDDGSDYSFFCQLLRQSGLEVASASASGEHGKSKADLPIFSNAAAGKASVSKVRLKAAHSAHILLGSVSFCPVPKHGMCCCSNSASRSSSTDLRGINLWLAWTSIWTIQTASRPA